MTTSQPTTKLDDAHFDSKARQWDDNPVFRKRGLKIAETVRATVPLCRDMHALDYRLKGSASGDFRTPNSFDT
jgi:hypothetical protein